MKLKIKEIMQALSFFDQMTFQESLNKELLRVLKNSESFGNTIQSNQNIQKESSQL